MSEKDPAPGDGNKPEPKQTAAQIEALEKALERIEALETKLSALESGEKEWTEKNLSPLRQQIADLQATLSEIPPNVTGQVKTLREELTQQLQELQQAVTQQPPLNPADPPPPPVEKPPAVPPQPPAPKSGSEGDHPAPPKKGKRVV